MTDPADKMRQFVRDLFTDDDDTREGHEPEPPAPLPNYARREGHTPAAPRADDQDMREFTRALFTSNDY